jgi:hypothetical protein
VTITCDAPASSKGVAVSAVTPPPTCSPPGNADTAAIAASVVPWSRLSMITWPPAMPSRRYILANSAEDVSVSKLVSGVSLAASPSSESFSVPPTICFTRP